ncbi:MAG: phosphoribosyltransferase [Spirochaetes bacterium]|nr:phosphoribosyltransferase [Spirochaetota bacterium]
MRPEPIASSDAIIDWWLAYSYRKENDKIFAKTFVKNKNERVCVGKFLQKHSLEKNSENYKELREIVYNKGVIDEWAILDENDGHDGLTYFSISYICSIFWLLEDLPATIDNLSKNSFKTKFLKEIEFISNGLIHNDVTILLKGVFGLYNIIKRLDTPKPIITSENPKFNLKKLGNFKDSEFKKFLQNCLSTRYNQFDVYSLFDSKNYENKDYLDILIDNVYHYIQNNDCNYIVAIERGGIPIASLVAYKFKIQCHILRTVPLLKVFPKLPSNSKIILFDDIVITGATINQAKKYLEEEYLPEKLISLSLVGKNGNAKSNKKLIDIKDSRKISHNLKYFNSEDCLEIERDINLRDLLKKRCIIDAKWHTEYTYTQDIFHRICDWFYEEIEKIDDDFVIIATSIYGLPYASVLSYKLKKPLFLFSRRSDYKHDFRTMSLENLENKIDYGLRNVVLIDDIFDTGITNRLIIDRLEKLKIDKSNIKSYVVANFSNDEEPISCLNKKMIDK